jgi:23S rRNA pseudouridine2605 synthase
MAEERLQKILSRAGLASRRKAEELIREGRVAVNGAPVTELGSKADLDRDHIRVDGKLLHGPKRLVHIALHKPNNYVTTVSDPEGRTTVMDLLRGVKERVYPVGRLDYHSEGLLLMTNDGEFANVLTSAASHVPKTYLVKVTGALTPEQEQAFREGIPLEGRRTAPAGLRMARRGQNPWYEVRLYEGRKNQIRMMFKHFGRLVEKLKRVQIGPVGLGSLKPGEYRYLTAPEVERLRRPRKASAARAAVPAPH